jgi:integrase
MFIAHKKASGTWNELSLGKQLRYFDRFCHLKYQNSTSLTQEMVDNWCNKRNTENNRSLSSRIYPIINFIRFLRSRKLTDVKEPTTPKIGPYTFIPHAFTDSELNNFFKACDELALSLTQKCYAARRFTVPVFFRLLYSSGIRTTEARLLRTEDVDLDTGVLNIRYSKGHNQHYVVLHDSMLELMREYSINICKFYKDRKFFFPGKNDLGLTAFWVTNNFKVIWSKYNKIWARAYDLRHNYAVENINSCINQGFDFDAKLCYLSKSMGHSTIESTKYYYSLVPKFADILKDLTDNDDLLPEVYYES